MYGRNETQDPRTSMRRELRRFAELKAVTAQAISRDYVDEADLSSRLLKLFQVAA